MIKLFSTPKDIVDLSSFDHVLHGSIVTQFEERFAEYVGAKYACSFNSATSALFLILKIYPELSKLIHVPSVIPPVVLNAILTSGHGICFTDNVGWVGHSYVLHTYGTGRKIIDSAQRVDRDQFRKEASDDDLMVFSFYPTKPVGSCDGGMVVSNSGDTIEHLRTASMNGMAFSVNSWERIPMFPGYKMYMNSVQAKIALKGLASLDDRKVILAGIREYYNKALGLDNTSDHLYRIAVLDNSRFIAYMKTKEMVCGRHYVATHQMSPYKDMAMPQNIETLIESERVGATTVSIPFHEELSMKDAKDVVGAIQNYG